MNFRIIKAYLAKNAEGVQRSIPAIDAAFGRRLPELATLDSLYEEMSPIGKKLQDIHDRYGARVPREEVISLVQKFTDLVNSFFKTALPLLERYTQAYSKNPEHINDEDEVTDTISDIMKLLVRITDLRINEVTPNLSKFITEKALKVIQTFTTHLDPEVEHSFNEWTEALIDNTCENITDLESLGEVYNFVIKHNLDDGELAERYQKILYKLVDEGGQYDKLKGILDFYDRLLEEDREPASWERADIIENFFAQDGLSELLPFYRKVRQGDVDQEVLGFLESQIRDYALDANFGSEEDLFDTEADDDYDSEVVSARELFRTYYEELVALDVLDGSAKENQKKFDLESLPDTHKFSSKLESLTFLKRIATLKGGKVNWKDFLNVTGITKDDKSSFEFFRVIFENQKSHVVTSDFVDTLIAKEKTEEHPLAFGSWGANKLQNSTKTKQLVIKLLVPEEVKKELGADQALATVFNRLWKDSQSSSLHPGGFGWARVSLLDGKSWLIDEIQSDFMYPSGGRGGLAQYRSDKKRFFKDFPDLTEEDFQRVDKEMNRLFGSWHQILLSSVLETARQNGVHELYMLTPELVASKSGVVGDSNKTTKIYDKLPRLLHFTKKETTLPITFGKSWTGPIWHRLAKKNS